MDIDDKDFYAVRKNLNVISCLILVLAYTNAKLNALSFLGIQIELEANRLYVAIFVLYLYFIWRFCTKVPISAGFWNDFVKHFLDPQKGVLSKHNFERYKTIILFSQPKLKNALERENSTRLNAQSIIRLDNKSLTKLRLALIFQTIQSFGDNGSQNINIQYDFKVSRIYVFIKFIIFCFKYDKFGDYLFPFLPVLANLFFFLLKPEWQGSFNSLFP